jgi:hypothetical protein
MTTFIVKSADIRTHPVFANHSDISHNAMILRPDRCVGNEDRAMEYSGFFGPEKRVNSIVGSAFPLYSLELVKTLHWKQWKLRAYSDYSGLFKAYKTLRRSIRIERIN